MNWTLPTYVVIYPITPPHAVTFPLRRAEMGCGGKDNWNPYRAYLLSDFRNSLPSKEANRLRPAFNVVMGKFQDRPARYERVKTRWQT
ncbi:hypothetical protein AVEN_255689-1 [Araneus ventricosus]|uniref:Uncharacterized protein n=1 Tax=Araneus ventricosus TaxID=182803 RepID=A0A4Y2VA98_ARAVE|nr:hypothetical protein AVEN_255689-1 [Araneus ventricosus]